MKMVQITLKIPKRPSPSALRMLFIKPLILSSPTSRWTRPVLSYIISTKSTLTHVRHWEDVVGALSNTSAVDSDGDEVVDPRSTDVDGPDCAELPLDLEVRHARGSHETDESTAEDESDQSEDVVRVERTSVVPPKIVVGG